MTVTTHQETSTAPCPTEPAGVMFFHHYDQPTTVDGRRPVVRVGRADRRDDGALIISSPRRILLNRGEVFLLSREPGGVFSDEQTKLGIYARGTAGPEVRVGTAFLSASRRRWSLSFAANFSYEEMICRPLCRPIGKA